MTWSANESLMILIFFFLGGNNLSFENPFTIRPVFYIIWRFCFCLCTLLVSSKWLHDHFPSDQLEFTSHPGKLLLSANGMCSSSLSFILHFLIFHDKGYFPCCMCRSDRMWMWLIFFFVLLFSPSPFFLDNNSVYLISAVQYIHLCCFVARP